MRLRISALAALLLNASSVFADVKVEKVLENLDNPCGVAIQPETNTVFVSDSGAGRIIRVVDGKAQDVITDFPRDVYGKGPEYNIGPLGLTFLDKDTLVVGDGGNPDGEELVRIYTVPEPGQDPIKADAMNASFGPLPAAGDAVGEGNFYAVAANEGAIYTTCNGDDAKGWISRAERNSKLGELTKFIATKEQVGVDAPVALTISPDGHLVVGQMGELTAEPDSLLTFYNASSGQLLLNLQTGLHDITALAYTRESGQLYALDFAWADSSQGGLFRLDGEGSGIDQTCNAVLITSLDKPTAMAVGPEDTLYVTILGTPKKDAKEGEKPGQLLKITGNL
jgi:DNA-binding beta-propeller fold protein YncE